MTRYKKEFKKRGFSFSEDYEFLPMEVGNGVLLEDRSLINTLDGFMIISYYNVINKHRFYDKHFNEIEVLEEDEYYNGEKFIAGTIRIWNDFPKYQFVYDLDDVLRYIVILSHPFNIWSFNPHSIMVNAQGFDPCYIRSNRVAGVSKKAIPERREGGKTILSGDIIGRNITYE